MLKRTADLYWSSRLILQNLAHINIAASYFSLLPGTTAGSGSDGLAVLLIHLAPPLGATAGLC